QLASLMMLSELGEPGAWTRVFTEPNLEKFTQPTVEGIDFPRMGIAQAWNDLGAGALWVETYPATTATRGAPTTWRVTRLPDPPSVTVTCDGRDFTAWRTIDAHTIELQSEIDDHVFRITTGHHTDECREAQTHRTTTSTDPAAQRLYVPA